MFCYMCLNGVILLCISFVKSSLIPFVLFMWDCLSFWLASNLINIEQTVHLQNQLYITLLKKGATQLVQYVAVYIRNSRQYIFFLNI